MVTLRFLVKYRISIKRPGQYGCSHFEVLVLEIQFQEVYQISMTESSLFDDNLVMSTYEH